MKVSGDDDLNLVLVKDRGPQLGAAPLPVGPAVEDLARVGVGVFGVQRNMAHGDDERRGGDFRTIERLFEPLGLENAHGVEIRQAAPDRVEVGLILAGVQTDNGDRTDAVGEVVDELMVFGAGFVLRKENLCQLPSPRAAVVVVAAGQEGGAIRVPRGIGRLENPADRLIGRIGVVEKIAVPDNTLRFKLVDPLGQRLEVGNRLVRVAEDGELGGIGRLVGSGEGVYLSVDRVAGEELAVADELHPLGDGAVVVGGTGLEAFDLRR